MRADELDRELCSGSVPRVRRALQTLVEKGAGPFYPRARVLRLLADEHPDAVREAALRVVLQKGLHPLEEERIRTLLEESALPLFRMAVRWIGKHAFPSAASDALRHCWEVRGRTEEHLAILTALPALGASAARRFLADHDVLRSDEPRLVSAGLSVLVQTGATRVDHVFHRALRHPDPRNRSTALEWLARRFEGEKRARILGSFLKDAHHRIRSTAAVLCFDDLPEHASHTLEAMSRSQTAEDRAAAAWGLGAVSPRHEGAVASLQRLAEDSDARVSSRARQELASVWKRSAA